MLMFLCIVNFQYLHHHTHNHHSEDSFHIVKVMKSDHCKICDHFLHQKNNAVRPGRVLYDFAVITHQPVNGGLYLPGRSSALVLCFSNKGPPLVS